MSEPDAQPDVVELCILLQCLGYTVKSLDTSYGNLSQDGAAGARSTVVINCQTSGIHVVLESGAMSCSCPAAEQNSGFWQVSGVAGGKQQDKETGSSLLRSLPKFYRERLSKELNDMVRSIKTMSDAEDPPKVFNKSASMIELTNRSASLVEIKENKSASVLEMGTPDKRNQLQINAETPGRFRSLDALTSVKEDELPMRMLQKQYVAVSADNSKLQTSSMCRRQSTYTICSTPGSVRRRNKTSSPIQAPQPSSLLDNLIEAERTAENLRMKLAAVIRELDDKNDSSMCGLDVSKISVLKATDTNKAQYVSSPNLSLLTARDDLPSRLKRQESASTSNLAKSTPESKIAKLRRISPNIFGMRKDNSTKDKDAKSKMHGLFKPKIVKPISSSNTPERSPSLSSASKKKYSHIKSTIPRPSPTPKKE